MNALKSNLRDDERVVVFTTSAHLSPDGSGWLVPIHAWVSRPADSVVRLALMQRALTAITGRVPDDRARENFKRLAGLLIADNKRNRRIVVRMAGKVFSLPPTAPNGHAEMIAIVSIAAAREAAVQNRLRIEVVAADGDGRTFAGEALLVPPEGVCVISDVDDTVKITHVTDRARMLQATFLDDFVAVPGMAERYRGWEQQGAALHFVSSSPWHLYEPLTEHLRQAGFPPASMDLKFVRLKDRTFLDLFRPGSHTKPPVLRALVQRYPQRRFVLVGDSGEKDPEVYAGLLREFPGRIAAVYIRNVTGASPGDARFRPLLNGPDADRWRLFADAHELPPSLP